jgi:hypothetical protein
MTMHTMSIISEVRTTWVFVSPVMSTDWLFMNASTSLMRSEPQALRTSLDKSASPVRTFALISFAISPIVMTFLVSEKISPNFAPA